MDTYILRRLLCNEDRRYASTKEYLQALKEKIDVVFNNGALTSLRGYLNTTVNLMTGVN